MQFSSAGTIAYCPCGSNGPDGIAGSGIPTGLYMGIAGPIFPTRLRYVAGVFLDDNEPVDPPPASLSFSDGAFTEISPDLRQIFFMGDGLTDTGTGDPQTIHVPDGATRLFMGFMDSWDGTGLPGGYSDNTGSVSVTITFAPTGVGNAPVLHQLHAVPNPFSENVGITIAPAVTGAFRLEIYDVQGRLIRALASGTLSGQRQFDWNGETSDGRRASSGVYYIRLTSPGGVETRKLVLTR